MAPKLKLKISKSDLLWLIAAFGIISTSISEESEQEADVKERIEIIKNYTYQVFLEKLCINLLNKFLGNLRKQEVSVSMSMVQAYTLFEFLENYRGDNHLNFEPELHRYLIGKPYPFKALMQLSKEKVDYHGGASMR